MMRLSKVTSFRLAAAISSAVVADTVAVIDLDSAQNLIRL